MTIYDVIASLINYGLAKHFIEKSDVIYIQNKYLHIFKLENFEEGQVYSSLNEVMEEANNYVIEKGIEELENLNIKDAFDSYIMDVMLPRPSQVIDKFNKDYEISPLLATSNYYQFAIDSYYVRTDRLANNIVYHDKGEKIELDITINLSKPEKDPKEIAKLKTMKSSSYPKCLLCKENEGYYGTFSKPGRSNHRIIPLKLEGDEYYLQYSPYGYFNEHCIIFNKEHIPMKIEEKTFARFYDFLSMFPHYTIGSNADLPIVGGSILTHDHYQGGEYTFPLAKAKGIYSFKIPAFTKVNLEIVEWPLSVIRLQATSKEDFVNCSTYILNKWQKYSDPECGFVAFDEVLHNTITPIARKMGNTYEIDLVLRNNCVSEQYPLGIFHPHNEYHHIKKENIGLIEVLGLAILPGRLKNELKSCEKYLLDNSYHDEMLEKHLDWLEELKIKYTNKINQTNVEQIIRHEVTLVFEKVLENCGVFKQDANGLEHFKKFIKTL